MRTKIILAVFCCFAALPLLLSAADIEVYFSPKGGCEKAIVREIDRAKNSIDAAVYYFTKRQIADAIIRAKDRGVKIKLVLDKSQETQRYSKAAYLARKGVPVRINSKYNLMYNKYAIIDGRTVITGSYNWTATAEHRNAENLLIIRDDETAGLFLKNFNKLFGESVLFVEKEERDVKAVVPVAPKVSKPDKPPASADEGSTVYITRTGTRYHRPDCPLLKNCAVTPKSLEEARRIGYRPCSTCKPPN